MLVVIAVLAIFAYAIVTARRSQHPVGFSVVPVESASGPVAVAIWYPTSGTSRPTTFAGGSLLSVAPDGAVKGNRLPVVVMSHGNGGSALSHVDLAMDLASAGYVVAAPTHAGDNYADQSRQGSPELYSQRALQVTATLDYLLHNWVDSNHVDGARIGAYGMSAGAFTVLTLVGGSPRMDLIQTHCHRAPEFICKALAYAKSPLLTTAANAGSFRPDSRIRAAAIAAPGLGFTFDRGGLARVRVPVQVWSGEHDDTVPFATNAQVVEQGLGRYAEPHRIPGATHMSFLAPCGLMKPPALCGDPDGFDREAAHVSMNKAIILFFNKHLAPGPVPGMISP